METTGTQTSLQIHPGVDGNPYVVIKQVVEHKSGDKESMIILTLEAFEDMVASYQNAKDNAIATINLLHNTLKDLGES